MNDITKSLFNRNDLPGTFRNVNQSFTGNAGDFFNQNTRSDTDSRTTTLNSTHNSRRGPNYPQYSITCIRLSTFQTWPTSIQQHPETMAEAGFYYTGNNDHVRCFHCGIGLQNWDSEDNPFVEHARWSAECQFLKDKKGLDFIATVQDAVRRVQLEEALNTDGIAETFDSYDEDHSRPEDLEPSWKPPTKAEKKNPLLTDAAQSILTMGYSSEVIRIVVDRVLKEKGWAGLSSRSLMEEIYKIEDSGKIELTIPFSSKLKHSVVSRRDMKVLPKELKRTVKKLKRILNFVGSEGIFDDKRKDSVINDRVQNWISVIYQKEKNCTMCKVQGHAIGYCSDCPGFIDEICMLFHEKIKKYGNHRVADYRLVPSKFCNEHRNLKMDWYCANCCDLICPRCVEEHTKQGHNVDSANDLFMVLNSIHKTKSFIEEIVSYLPVSNSDERAVLHALIASIDSTFGIVSDNATVGEISLPGAMNTPLEKTPSENIGNMKGISTAKTSLYRTFSFGAILEDLTTIQRYLHTYLITNRQVFKSNERTGDETYPKVAGNGTEYQPQNDQNVMLVSRSGETFVTCQEQEEPILSETFGPITMANLSFQTSDLFPSLQHPQESEHGEKTPEQEIAALQGDLDNQINLDSFENLHPPQ